MIKNINRMLVLSLFLSIFFACTKDVEPAFPNEPEIENSENSSTEGKKEEESDKDPGQKPGSENSQKPGSQQAFEMGTGSGDLKIDGSHPSLKDKNLILVKGGTYKSISIVNFKGTQTAPIVIKNNGQVFINNSMDISNVSNLVIAGDQSSSIKYGFSFHDIGYRAVYLGDRIDGLTLKNMSFRNVGDYVIFSTVEKTDNDGTLRTRTQGLKILNSEFNKTGSIAFFGKFENGTDRGFVNDVEIAYNTFSNSSAGSALFMHNVNNYNIHHNVVNNYNVENNSHNGIFHMIGAGKFHHNKFTNYQGNMIRAWLFARTSNPLPVEIYNNVAYNTRKYGAFELQGFDRNIISGKSTHTNAKVYNNTVGKMNTNKDWEGLVLDLYNYGGTLEYYNNLGFELNGSQKFITAGMINNMSDVKIIKNSNNLYFSKASDAVNDTNSLQSRHAGIGSPKL